MNEIEPGTVVAGRYRVERRLGEGGMGSVYAVEHQLTGQPLALKVLNPTLAENAVALERFRREARAPARIASEHVVQVTDADVAPELGGAPFLVMELLRGENFDEFLERRGALPSDEAIAYLRQIARALDRAHAIGVVHRDIKPENLFLTEREDGSPCVKLLDFGIARLGGEAGAASQTATGEILGTPLYMSPEQTLGRADKISPRTDVWAFGLIAHKMLTGREPWTAENLTALIGQIAYEPLPVPSRQGCTLGAAYDGWFARACAREPEDRFAGCGEAVEALAQVLGLPADSAPAISRRFGAGEEARSAGRAPDASLAATAQAAVGGDTLAAHVGPRPRASRRILAVAAGLAVVGGVGAFVALGRSAPPPGEVAAAEDPAPVASVAEAQRDGGGADPPPAPAETAPAPSASAQEGADPAPVEPPPAPVPKRAAVRRVSPPKPPPAPRPQSPAPPPPAPEPAEPHPLDTRQ